MPTVELGKDAAKTKHVNLLVIHGASQQDFWRSVKSGLHIGIKRRANKT